MFCSAASVSRALYKMLMETAVAQTDVLSDLTLLTPVLVGEDKSYDILLLSIQIFLKYNLLIFSLL